MRNKLSDLNDYLFEQLERITDEDLTPEELDKELKRSDALTDIAKTIIENGKLALNVKKHLDEYNPDNTYQMPGMLENKK